MKIEFVKDHPAGIKKGHKCIADFNHATRMIKEGFAKEVKAKKESKKK